MKNRFHYKCVNKVCDISLMGENYKKTRCGLLLIILFLSVNISAISNETISFEGAGWQVFNITIGYSHINDFTFDISGKAYNSSYPSNVTVSFGNDSNVGWSYMPYNSSIAENASLIEFSWSTSPSTAQIDFMSGNVDGTYLARLTNNLFTKSGASSNGNIAIGSADNINAQVLEIITDNSSTHAFLPFISPLAGGYAGLYLTKGGSTYYCNSDHNFSAVVSCNLTLAEALVPEHLARGADIINFSWLEPVSSPSIVSAINSRLQSCGVPCNVSINVSSATAGNITFSEFAVVGPEPPANISIISENSTYYQINISSEANLTSVKYSFGKIPVVNIIPIVANDDEPILTASQRIRYNILIDNLASAWDNLTNYSHPLNFTFYQNPKVISDYSIGENNFLTFSSNAFILAETLDSSPGPNINVILDIHDYFPNEGASNLRSPAISDNVIGKVYMNGFSDSNNKTSQYFYYNEILMNTLLHELAHTFIFYPQSNGSKLFYTDHPASFTNISGFETYNVTKSPTGSEGYYEIYSILNQLRVYIGKADIGNVSPLLSPLDKMLLGILSYHEDENYTFYNANITWESDRYNVSEITPIIYNNTYDIYIVANRDIEFWDVRSDSTKIDMGTSTSFLIPKASQGDSALWVFAGDIGHPDYFKVFNNNAYSTNQTIINSIFSVNLISPYDTLSSYDNSPTFYCRAYGNISNITLYTNIGGWGIGANNLSGGIINYTISNLNPGTYKWNCLAYNGTNNYLFASNYTFTILGSVPHTTLGIPKNALHTRLTNIKFACNASDEMQLTNMSLYGNWSGGWHANETVNVSGTSNSTIFTKVLPEGTYEWNCKSINNLSSSAFASSNRTLIITNLTVTFNSSKWDMSETTNFSNKTVDELRNLSYVRFKNSLGRISFKNNLSILRNLDIKNKINIKSNYIFINSSALPEFDISANLTLFGLNFSNVYVLRDGTNCTSCVIYNYSGGVLNFGVNGFSTYSAGGLPTCSDGVMNGDETGVDCGGSCSACNSGSNNENSGGGGGSGASISPIVEHKDIQVIIPENITRKITNDTIIFIYLENPTNGLNLTGLNLTVSSNITNLSVMLDRYYIKNISAGETQKINLSINGSKGEYEINFSIYIESLNITKVFTMKVNLTKEDYNEAVVKDVKQIDSESRNISWIWIIIGIVALILIFIFAKKGWNNISTKSKDSIAIATNYIMNLEKSPSS